MVLYTRIQQSLNCLIDLFLPSLCVLCHSPAPQRICHACRQDLPILTDHCAQCAQFFTAPLSVMTPPFNPATLTCGACLTNPPPFDHIYPLFPYQRPIIQLIVQLKFQQQLAHAALFANLLLERIQQTWYLQQALPQLIIPIPLHPQRLRERGFNQALEVAKPVAKALNIPIDRHGVQRIKATAAQSGLSAIKRKDNVTGAFACTRDYRGLRIAVVDDVITTGHTVAECCRVLRERGASEIHVWCCARR
jgi:ComF family protein